MTILRNRRWVRILAAMEGALALSAVAQAQTAQPFTTERRFDIAGRQTGTIMADPDGASGQLPHPAIRTVYNAAGQVISVESGYLREMRPVSEAPRDWSGFTVLSREERLYDEAGNLSLVRRTVEGLPTSVVQYTWDSLDRLVCEAVRMAPAATPSLLADGCRPSDTNAAEVDRVTVTSYDNQDRVLKVRKAVGTSVEQVYVEYTYNLLGLREDVVDANGNRARMAYDGFDRLRRWSFPSATTGSQVSASDYEEYNYDAVGNRTSLRKRDGRRISFSYDALNRVISKTYPDGGARGVFYSYDLRGLQTAARFDDLGGSEAVLTSYTGFGEISTSTTVMGGISRTFSYKYDADGNRIHLTHPDGIWFRRAYDGLDRLTTTLDQDGVQLDAWNYDEGGRLSSTFGGGQQFGHDNAGRLTSLNTTIGTTNLETFKYNAAGQVKEATRSNDAYAWTGAVNVDRGYVVNGLNQYKSAGGVEFTYDANGNLTQSGGAGYVYDVENRLVSTSRGVVLSYDPLGRLWRVTGPGTHTEFLTDGDEITAEYGKGGQVLRRYVHGTGADDPRIWYEGSDRNDMRYLVSNRQGSIVQAARRNSQPVAINTFDEYGIPGAENQGRFQYTGQAWIPELGMYHYKARLYSPTLGRFLQTDPIGYDDQVNLYTYVANDPVNNTDPDGQECVTKNTTTCGVATTATAATAVAAREGMGAERARSQYREATGKLAPNDSAGRSAAKASARSATPPITRGVVEGMRPGLGPKPGSGGTANRTNVGADRLAGRLGTAGRVAGVAGVAIGVARVATSDNPGQEAARVGGGIAGAIAGVEGGATVGALGGPWGAAAGGIVGGLVGGFAGEKAVDKLLDW